MASLANCWVLGARLRCELEVCLPSCAATCCHTTQAVHIFGYVQRLKSPTSGALYASLVHACLKCASPLKAQQVHTGVAYMHICTCTCSACATRK